MKVVCESCQAKYQVPDERVAGKKLKIRCKRCGATVLIRGDLAAVGLADSIAPSADSELSQAAPAAELEWHASIDGQSYGPFDTSTLLRWLDAQPGGWDAHVWRDGFTDWVEVRTCPELMAAAPSVAGELAPIAGVPELAAPSGDEPHETSDEEGPTRTFSNEDVGVARRPKTLTGAQSPDEMRSRSSAIRTRSSPSFAAAAAAPAAAVGGGWSGGASASPRVTAAQAMTGERHEDSVLFSTSNLQQVAMTTSQPGYSSMNPGFASGEASGLIDIRALASLAKQSAPQIAPGAAYDRFRADDDSRMAVMNQTGAFNRVDSLAPVATTSTSSSAAVPLAILGGFALVAAAAFAAILITREAKQPEAASIPVVPETATAAATQPTVTPEPPPTAAPAPAAAAPAPTAEEKTAEPTPAEPENEALANGKPAKRSRATRTASEEKSKDTIPAEKAKPKKEKESAPPSSDEVMLAAKPAPAPKPEKAEPEPKHEAHEAKQRSGNSDIDDLLGGTSKPAAKTAPKNRSIDDLLDGAGESKPAPKKEAAPAPTPSPAASAAADEASDMPPSPSRDEVLAAMRGVESPVRACATGGEKGTAEVQITVSGTTGRVTNATVTGITGEVGSCIARAARNAKFPKFSKPTFQVKYPYRFQ
jgi:predicted Zn finger-like uncharacterized protein